MSALLKAHSRDAEPNPKTKDLIEDVHMSAWRIRGLGEAISLVREVVPAIYDDSRESALVSASLHALDTEAGALDKLATSLFDRQVKIETIADLPPTTKDPHADWFEEWKEADKRWHEAAQGMNADHDEPEKEAAEDEKVRLANLIGRTKAQTLEGMLIQAEYWLTDFGDYYGEDEDLPQGATLKSIRDGLKAHTKKDGGLKAEGSTLQGLFFRWKELRDQYNNSDDDALYAEYTALEDQIAGITPRTIQEYAYKVLVADNEGDMDVNIHMTALVAEAKTLAGVAQ